MNNRSTKRIANGRRLSLQSLENRFLLAGDVGMTNLDNPYDVNGDKVVSAGDALGVINTLNKMQSLAEGESIDTGTMQPDTNGDGRVTTSDALGVINVLSIEGEDHVDDSVPDPVVRKFRVHQGNTTYIEFEGDHVVAEVEVLENGDVRLSAAGLEETISVGSPNVLKLRVEGHHNLLVATGIQVKDDLILDVDGNQNHFALIDSYIGDDLIYLGAEGVDRVLLDNTVIGDDFEFHGRKVDDALVIRDSFIGDDFFFDGHRGADVLFADNVSVGDDAFVRMGDGDDIGAIQNVRVGDRADIDAQDDYDQMAIGVQNLTAKTVKVRGFDADAVFSDIESVIDSYLDDIFSRLV